MPAYQDYIARAQVSEAFTLADGLKTSISTNRQNGSCFANGKAAADGVDTIEGKYGTATILQDGTTGAADSLICGIHYQFKTDGVSDKLIGKDIVLKVNEDSGKLTLETVQSKDTSDGMNKYLPSAFKKS